jgi:hypothetical protein
MWRDQNFELSRQTEPKLLNLREQPIIADNSLSLSCVIIDCSSPETFNFKPRRGERLESPQGDMLVERVHVQMSDN